MITIINGNKYKRIFIVGDIHGCYTLLMLKLKEIGFNFEEDLLIATGDLVDRGPENLKCVELLDKEWFLSVRGNHEQFCIDGIYDDTVSFYHEMKNNGGAWFYELPEDYQLNIVEKFKQLPLMLEIHYKDKKYGVVHADLPYQCWEHTKAALESKDKIDDRSIEDVLMWSRKIISKNKNITIQFIDSVFFGHTPLQNIKQLGNCVFLDTGAVFGGSLSIVEIGKCDHESDGLMYTSNPPKSKCKKCNEYFI